MVDPLLVSIPEAAELLGIKRTKMFELLAAGEIPTRRIGTRSLIAITDLEDFVQRLPLTERRQNVSS
jgi:excisionase family DNA binding protein